MASFEQSIWSAVFSAYFSDAYVETGDAKEDAAAANQCAEEAARIADAAIEARRRLNLGTALSLDSGRR